MFINFSIHPFVFWDEAQKQADRQELNWEKSFKKL